MMPQRNNVNLIKRGPVFSERRKLAVVTATAAILVTLLSCVGAQSVKGTSSQSSRQAASSSSSLAALSSPIAQMRQQQQQQQQSDASQAADPPATKGDSYASGTKRRPPAQQQQQQQQQQTSYAQKPDDNEDSAASSQATEDPLANSEPALYGSVAGAPGVDFPAYTRVPKTSFSCDGKGFDFGFYADQEAGCQVYHVCWSGRHESFLCGVGTVFNQAILACDYWHSVDCSKASQYYSVNSELGKTNAEPASGSSSRTFRQPAPLSSSSSTLAAGGYGGRQPIQQQSEQRQPRQQQQYSSNDDLNIEQVPQQQQVREPVQQTPSSPPPAAAATFGTKTEVRQQQQQQSAPQKDQQLSHGSDHDQQQQIAQSNVEGSTKRDSTQTPAITLAAPVAKRPRVSFSNIDFNQKVNSLIDSPVRPPIKTSPRLRQQQQQQPALASPTKQAEQQPVSFAQLPLTRAQQFGGKSLSSGSAAAPRKATTSPNEVVSSVAGNQPAQQQQQQQQNTIYDNDLDEPQSQSQQRQQQQQQQQADDFDDTPVQTSTAQTTPAGRVSSSASLAPIRQTIIRAGGSGDGSSAITSQYDTLTPAGVNYSGPASFSDQSYDSSLDDSSDDFKAAGARAAASQNQNWYIMRTI